MRRRVAVVGGGIAGLVVAWDLVRGGCAVTLLEAGPRLGGAIGTHRLGGVEVDAGAESFATRSAAVPRLIGELGLQDSVIAPDPSGAWLQLPDLAAPLPATGILGIPADPLAADVVRIIGAEAAARAAEDRGMPVDAWRGREDITVGELVLERMGPAVLEKLVTPIVSGVHSARPEQLDAGNAAPGLVEAMLREGSLAGAVASVKAQAPAGAAVNSLHGGLSTLIRALEEALRAQGVEVRLGERVTDLPALLSAHDHVVLAVDAPAALRLLEPVAPQASAQHDTGQHDTGAPGEPAASRVGRGVALVSLLLDAPELDARPRGTGMLVAPGVDGVGAKAMTHVSSKWPWVAEALGPGRHLVRLSYGRVTDVPGTGALGLESADELLLAAARADVATLFELPQLGEQVLEADVVRWEKALPQASAGHARRIRGLREELADSAVSVVGSWFAGTGLARVVPDARRAAAEILAT
ncbi:protoporphyrinogen oxidase [Nesterenkonia sp. HG001]|uniref:protoporphyrinogen oxidase n=1 Tax=Nesterenkonia sp. HG001 TaxID=2983207 RepID=UPI002AC69154|nr:protoporphyrinogen oxidase [Nesterenkonia sp. HG001]MDZ5076304.1 protoporphyrinogen oxidase [Nesterenkonia sp. HG001]